MRTLNIHVCTKLCGQETISIAYDRWSIENGLNVMNENLLPFRLPAAVCEDRNSTCPVLDVELHFLQF